MVLEMSIILRFLFNNNQVGVSHFVVLHTLPVSLASNQYHVIS